MEKKFARLEAARSTDVTSLQTELDSLKVGAREQLNERDAKINELVEELGNTQALLSDKSNELDQVGPLRPTHNLPFGDNLSVPRPAIKINESERGKVLSKAEC